MNKIKQILADVDHRPWEMPDGNWVYYQEWNRLFFLHFEVSFESLRKLVPLELELDDFEGKYYISIVPFTMEGIRPRFLPSIGIVSDFEELNVRTYVKTKGKSGVYFLNIEAGNSLSAFVSRTLSGLPYENAEMQRKEECYYSMNENKKFFLKAEYKIGTSVLIKTPLQIWLTERYCLYLYVQKILYRYQIHHKEWEIKEINFDVLELEYNLGEIRLTEDNVLIPNYSEGIQVVSWGREKVV